ncbi:MAG: CDP-diacylglycerol--glycerol-3-phosphate 3-phosphatidyltransferase [Clostridia bacterium]|nr:CDP-diacylglycerol--glycerol-3-phosphate 3-phosphatidyltransferase [Clostridia bacterium]
MNLPNKLTVLRLILVPVFVAVFYITAIPYNYLISAIIFTFAACTDFLDGYIARKYNLVTDFGKFLDPIADKLLVCSAIIIMLLPNSEVTIMPWYCSIGVAIIISRELLVSGFRLIASTKNRVIPADMAGKIKTFVQDIAIVVLLVGASIFPQTFSVMNIVGLIIFGISVLLTIISGAECIIKNIDILKEKKEENK